MSADTDAAKKTSDDKKETLTLEKIIRRPKFTETKEARQWVNRIYTRECASYTVFLKNICPLRNRTIRFDNAKKEISIVDMGTCNKFLDCFAPSITKLKIEYSESESELKHRAQFDRIVNKYCAEFITELTIINAPKEAMMKMKKPFSKIETVQFDRCNIMGKLADFNYCFPNMKKLSISDQGVNRKRIDGKCIAKHFPNLEYLRVDIKGPSTLPGNSIKGSIQKKYMAEALQLNPQLRSLKTGSGWTAKFLKEVSRYLQQIESLELEYVDDLDSGTINLKSVKKCAIECIELNKIPFSFNQLEELSLQFCDSAFKHNDIIEFIVKHSTITKLDIKPIFPISSIMNRDTKLKIAKGLTSLTDVNLEYPESDVIIFLTECKLLKRIRFQLETVKEFETLRASLGAEWNATKEMEGSFFFAMYVILERAIDQNLQSSER